ncbi:TMAO reductase system periplasmic protein TorT [Paracoccus sp. p4-l81]|uniref:TMAO reductase system periplasmic protein TorT n=1 Tax=unclassified Paracoccus (in: a-proteobacteria) TaxID=2688777 RepID=UPI0035BA4C43
MNPCYAARIARAIALSLGVALTGATSLAAAPVCVLVPHFKDEYWLSVGFGLESRARDLGMDLTLHEAGGYRARDRQIAQIDDCVSGGAAAILIGAVSSDHPDLIAALDRAAARVPVVALVNELHFSGLSGAIGVDWRVMGQVLGRALAGGAPAGQPVRRAVLISGPPESGWVAPLESGLRAGLAGSAVQIVAVHAADTGLRQQFAAVARVFAEGPPPDILIGSAPAIEAAMGYLAAHPDQPRPLLAASYVSHSVRRGLAGGQVAAAPFDDPVAQGQMAADLLARVLAGAPRPTGWTGPQVVLLGAGAAADRVPLSPAGYFPAIR